MSEEYKANTNEELLGFYCNAKSTGAGCAGHGKMAWNHRVASQIRQELEFRKIAVPSDQEAYQAGIFNGEGSV